MFFPLQSTISGNTVADVMATCGTRLSLFGTNTIGILPITCDATVLSRGTTRRP
jgi:hypothetical protein